MNTISLKGALKYDFNAKKIYSKVQYKPYKTIIDIFFNISEWEFEKLLESEAYFKNNSDYFSVEKKKNRVHIYCTYTNITNII